MNQKGFTLIELLVVVLIIGILAAMALPQYFKAVERSRMTEAVTLLANIAQAQQRKYMQINSYTENYKSLDVAPRGASGPLFYTKGDLANPGNGFGITLSGTTTYSDGIATAKRVNGVSGLMQYNYTLSRKYTSVKTTCDATGDENGKALCADFCGIENPVDTCCSDGATHACVN